MRKIKKNYRSVTGYVASKKMFKRFMPFESTLERDLLEILEYDNNVDIYRVQPVTITYCDSSGKKRRYTPDVFIQYRRDIMPAKNMRHMLCEVKYLDDLKKNGREWRDKFKAASKYAGSKGWKFKILTEQHIRTPFLDNVKFFKRYSNYDINCLAELVMERIQEMRMCTPEGLLTSISDDREVRARLMPHLWYLISARCIGADLNKPFNMKSLIWAMETGKE